VRITFLVNLGAFGMLEHKAAKVPEENVSVCSVYSFGSIGFCDAPSWRQLLTRRLCHNLPDMRVNEPTQAAIAFQQQLRYGPVASLRKQHLVRLSR
jgi:hypothetical protein